jgi:hypothetical protein
MTLDHPQPAWRVESTSICSTSPGSAPSIHTGPVSAWMRVRSMARNSFGRHAGLHLAAAGVHAFKCHSSPGSMRRRGGSERSHTEWVGFGGERVFRHDSFTLTVICTSTRALRGNAFRPTAARTWRPASPNTCTSRSEAPLMIAGESGKPRRGIHIAVHRQHFGHAIERAKLALETANWVRAQALAAA